MDSCSLVYASVVSPSSSCHNLTWKGLAHVITGKCLKNFNIFSAFGNMIDSLAKFLFLKVIICRVCWRLNMIALGLKGILILPCD
jgi:hypothetical protein